MPDYIASPESEQREYDRVVNEMRRRRGAKAGEPNTPEENKAGAEAAQRERERSAAEDAEHQKKIGISGYFGRGFTDSGGGY